MLKFNRTFLIVLTTVYAVVAILHVVVVRPMYMEWGSTLPEIILPMPGDDEYPSGTLTSTRAVTVSASASEIWQWIAQLGQHHAGWYSFDWLENLFAANMHNADVIVPDWQSIRVGDQLPFLEGGASDTFTAEVTAVLPDRSLVMEGWTIHLIPIDETSTRLVVRYPALDAAGVGALYYYPVFEPAHFMMEAGMMLGIKARAESLPEARS